MSIRVLWALEFYTYQYIPCNRRWIECNKNTTEEIGFQVILYVFAIWYVVTIVNALTD